MRLLLTTLAFVVALLASLTAALAVDVSGRYTVVLNGQTWSVDFSTFGNKVAGIISGPAMGRFDAVMTSDTVFMGTMTVGQDFQSIQGTYSAQQGILIEVLSSLQPSSFTLIPVGGLPPPPPPPPREVVYYYLDAAGGQAGPVNIDGLSQLARQGTVRPETQIWTDGMPNWAAANTVPALGPIFVVPEPPPPPPPPEPRLPPPPPPPAG